MSDEERIHDYMTYAQKTIELEAEITTLRAQLATHTRLIEAAEALDPEALNLTRLRHADCTDYYELDAILVDALQAARLAIEETENE